MTLCTAFIRQANNTEELVFATDSCLTGGEKWKHGIKLFELPRKDCLLCFAGSTMRAYPLVLNLISSIHLDNYLQSPAARLEEVLVYTSELFTELVKKIISEVSGEDIHELRGDAKFLFGGWDWESNSFKVWMLYYSREVDGFIFKLLNEDSTKKRFYVFLGDPSPKIEENALMAYKQMLYDQDIQDDPINMEPLKILRDVSLNPTVREVDGSLQIAKVYKSNKTEFFGIYWESSKGKPYFQGREYNEMNKPLIRYFDPDTFEIYDSELPEKLSNISKFEMLEDFNHIKVCYDEDGFLKKDLSEKQKYKLKLIFKDIAYKIFLNLQFQTTPPEGEQLGLF
jgi:hypothetical protein